MSKITDRFKELLKERPASTDERDITAALLTIAEVLAAEKTTNDSLMQDYIALRIGFNRLHNAASALLAQPKNVFEQDTLSDVLRELPKLD